MIIGPDFVYLHVPKTAGSSFEQMMEKRHGLKAANQHDTARDIPPEHRDKFIFGFMREPVDAEVSNWRYHRSSWKHNAFFTFENWCHWRHNNEKEYGALMGLPPDPVEYGHDICRAPAGYLQRSLTTSTVSVSSTKRSKTSATASDLTAAYQAMSSKP